MKLLDKILYLQDSQKLSDHEFAHKFKIKQTSLLKWKKEQIVPKRSDLITLCNAFSLDIDDFMNDSSTLLKNNIQPGEHLCSMKKQEEKQNVILEDFAPEDNSRYEERD